MKFSPVNIDERAKLDIRSGDRVRVSIKIQEKGKTRLQAFEGLVIARKHGREPGATFTVRKIASGIGVEKIFPLYSPMIDKVEVVRRSKVRRAKLYYIRQKSAKDIRRKMKGLAEFVPVTYQEKIKDEESGEEEKEEVAEKQDDKKEVVDKTEKKKIVTEDEKKEIKKDTPPVAEEKKDETPEEK